MRCIQLPAFQTEMITQTRKAECDSPASPPGRRLHLVATAGTVAAVGDLDQPSGATSRAAYEPAFWTGSYHKFTDAGDRSTDVFADVLWPQHVAKQLGLPDIAPPARVAAHLSKHFRPSDPGEGLPGHKAP